MDDTTEDEKKEEQATEESSDSQISEQNSDSENTILDENLDHQNFSESDDNKEAEFLDQDDIDALFGGSSADNKSFSDTKPSGFHAILESGQIYSERFPILDVVYDRFVRFLRATLRNFTGVNVEINCSHIKTTRFGEYLNSIPLPAIISIFQAVEWDNHGVLVLDSQMIYAMIDVLLGGRSRDNELGLRVDGKPSTAIERSLIEKLTSVILNDFTEAFEPITSVKFEYERLETNPRFAAVALEKSGILLVTFTVELEDHKGRFDIVLPYATIEPVRDILLQNFMGEKFGRDSIWENHLAEMLKDAELVIEATFPKETFMLKDVIDWKVGTQIYLASNMDSDIHMRSEGFDLMLGKLGQKNGFVAIKINDILFSNDGEKL